MRPENQNPDHHRAGRCQEDGAGGHVFGLLGDGMEIRRGHVRQKLERRVERLRGPDRRDGSAIQHHSLTDNPTTRPAAMTRTVAVACSQALCWVLSMVAIPRTANFTLRSRPVNVSGFDGVRSMSMECAHRTMQQWREDLTARR